MRSGTMLKVSPLINGNEVHDCWINLAQIDRVIRMSCTVLNNVKYSVRLSGEDLALSEEDYNLIKNELGLP